MSNGDPVTVYLQGEVKWAGSIVGNPVNSKARASVRYQADEDGKKEPGVEDDLAAVTVTVTNSDGEESDPVHDQAIIDGP